MMERKVKKFMFFITFSMILMFIGAVIIAFLAINHNNKQECISANDVINVPGKVIDVTIDDNIMVKYKTDKKYIVEFFDICTRKSINKYVIEND